MECDSGFEQWVEHQKQRQQQCGATELDEGEDEHTAREDETKKRRREHQATGSATELMPFVVGATAAAAPAPLPGQAWEAEVEMVGEDAQMRDSAEAIEQQQAPKAKRPATEVTRNGDGGDDAEVSMRDLMKLMSTKFSEVLRGQETQFEQITPTKKEVSDLRVDTERSVGALASRIDAIEMGSATGEKGQKMQTRWATSPRT